MAENEEKPLEKALNLTFLLAKQVKETAEEAKSFKLDCKQMSKLSERLLSVLAAARLAVFASTCSFYERPFHRIIAEVTKNLGRAYALMRKCKSRNILRRLFTMVSSADVRKTLVLVESSVADMKWLLSVFDIDAAAAGGGFVQSLPPIASNDPIVSWVWSYIASLYMGQLNYRIEAANELISLAKDNDRNKKIIVEEGGIPPLLKLLKENLSPEAQFAAATALLYLANDQERVRLIVEELGVPIIVQVLGDSSMRVQILVARLVARMAEHDPLAQEDFARENVIRPLVTLLSFEAFVDDPKVEFGRQSIHSIVQINKEMGRDSVKSFKYRIPYAEGSSRGVQNRKERENQKPEVKLGLKISCAEALWMLTRGSVSNSKKLTETKGLLCLARLVENGQGNLQINCLMAIMEITAAAESNDDLRRAAFKTNSPAAKAVVDQLLRVITGTDSPYLQIPAIKSIGSLARSFPAKETRVIAPLVKQLSNRNQDVATEAAISLGKFVCSENFLRKEHSKTIIEFDGVLLLIRLLRGNERMQLHGLILLCYIALNAENHEALDRRVFTAFEGADRTVVARHPEIRELVSESRNRLNVYHSGVLPQMQSYVP